jgi:hypothetical protein
MSFISHFMISKAPHSEMGPLWYFFYSSAVFEQPVDGVTDFTVNGKPFQAAGQASAFCRYRPTSPAPDEDLKAYHLQQLKIKLCPHLLRTLNVQY